MIDNYRKPLGTVKRKAILSRIRIMTLGIKTVGLWRAKALKKHLVSKNDSDMIDDLIIDSKFGNYKSQRLLYDGPYLKQEPHADVLLATEKSKTHLWRKHHLPEDVK